MYRSCRFGYNHIVAGVYFIAINSVFNISFVAVVLEDFMKVFWVEVLWDICSQTELSFYSLSVEGKRCKKHTQLRRCDTEGTFILKSEN